MLDTVILKLEMDPLLQDRKTGNIYYKILKNSSDILT